MFDFYGNPGYQRAEQRRRSLSPAVQAVPQYGEIAGEFATEMAGNRLNAMRAGYGNDINRRRLDSSLRIGTVALENQRTGYDREYSTLRDRLSNDRLSNTLGTGVALANLGVSGLNAWDRGREADRLQQYFSDVLRSSMEQNDMRTAYQVKLLSMVYPYLMAQDGK